MYQNLKTETEMVNNETTLSIIIIIIKTWDDDILNKSVNSFLYTSYINKINS